MTNIYDKINDMKFDDKEIKLDDIEYKKMLNTAKSYSKKPSRKKYITIAAALLLVAGLSIKPVRAEVSKFVTDIKVSMMETIGASPESYKYVTELHKPIEIGGNQLMLENFVIEDDRIFATILEATNGKSISDKQSCARIYKVKINGEDFKSLSSSGSLKLSDDNKAFISESMTSFDKQFPKLENANIDLYIESEGSSDVVSVNSSSNIVNEDNKIFAENLSLENGAVLKLMKINPISMTAIIDNLDDDYSYNLVGHDEDGKEVMLDMRSAKNNKFIFLYNQMSELSLDELKDGRNIDFVLSSSKRNPVSGRETNGIYKKEAEFTLSAKQ